MAEDRRFSHPVPAGLVLAIVVATQLVAHLGLVALREWHGVTAPHWLAAAAGGAAAVLLVALLSRRLAKSW